MLVDVVLVLDPLTVLDVVLDPPEELVDPAFVPVDAVVVPEVVVPGVVAPDEVVPVRTTEPVAMPVEDLKVPVEEVAVSVDEETLVDEEPLSLALLPMEPQAERAKEQAKDKARHANTRAVAKLIRLNNIRSAQSS